MKRAKLWILALAGLVVVLVLTWAVGCLPVGILIDVSEKKLGTPSRETIDFLKTVDADVSISLVAQSGAEDTILVELMQRYQSANSRIHFKTVAPESDAEIAARFSAGELTDNSIIVSSEKRSRTILYQDLQRAVYSGYYQPTDMIYQADRLLAQSIQYVTRDDMPKVYALIGHGETMLYGDTRNAVEEANFEMISLSLDSSKVPDDASCVLINVPTSDLAKPEAEALLAYLKAGGKVILVTGYQKGDWSNLFSVTGAYGMQPEPGVVLEGNTTNYGQIAATLADHPITEGLAGTYPPLMWMAGHAIQIDREIRPSLAVSPFLTSAETSFIKEDLSQLTSEAQLAKKEGDREGIFTLAAAASEGEARLIWLGSQLALDGNINQYNYGANVILLSNMLGWGVSRVDSVEIPEKSLIVEALDLNSTTQIILNGVLIAIPTLILIAGTIIVIRRRKRMSTR